MIIIDVEGEPLRLALAWAHAAHTPAGAFWPAAFGHAAALRGGDAIDDAIEWLRSVALEADRLVVGIVEAEIQAGWAPVPGPKFPAWSEDDSGIELEWDTSVSLILEASAEAPDRLRLRLVGAHPERERLIREALDRPDRERAIEAWDWIASLRK